MTEQTIALATITLLAAVVNGALGYGFSSITVPIALLFLVNRVLNPALVLIEVVLNAYVLWNNRDALPNVWRRVVPIVVGLMPGIAVGTAIVAQVNPSWLRFATFIVLLPLILVQAAGYRRPIRSERSAGLVFGGALGVLYSVTTISGPPLAIVLNNQGLAKKDFRAALGVIRLAESSMTAVAYAYVGLFTATSLALIPWIVPSILIGVPIGAFIIQRVRAETFRRVCMSFDAWIVGFGLSRLLNELKLVDGNAAYIVLVVVAVIDIWLLYRFFSAGSASASATVGSLSDPTSSADWRSASADRPADRSRDPAYVRGAGAAPFDEGLRTRSGSLVDQSYVGRVPRSGPADVADPPKLLTHRPAR